MSDVRNLPLDRRFAKKVALNPHLREEQSPNLLSSYGGVENYITLTQETPDSRVVYSHILNGISSQEELGELTGLSASELGKIISELKRKGLIYSKVVTEDNETT